jgi:hypothetical protein
VIGKSLAVSGKRCKYRDTTNPKHGQDREPRESTKCV